MQLCAPMLTYLVRLGVLLLVWFFICIHTCVCRDFVCLYFFLGGGGCSQGHKFGPFSMEFRWFFPILKKKNPNFQKKNFLTHKLHGDILLQLNGNSMCNSLFVFLLTRNDINVQNVHYNKFPNNFGVYCAIKPALKGPRAPSQICKKSLVCKQLRLWQVCTCAQTCLSLIPHKYQNLMCLHI